MIYWRRSTLDLFIFQGKYVGHSTMQKTAPIRGGRRNVSRKPVRISFGARKYALGIFIKHTRGRRKNFMPTYRVCCTW